ncbi:cation diffusion facilitator family transporter [Akkermansiaceae bacterium]|nr:cation diffusion facilitator family transporter [Akkermansiaceae bacterium]MDB4758786.1 cation diffusion facilitator family transporter [Akkermansiaceae bacterium]
MSHNHHHSSSDNLKVAFFLNLVFTIIEIFGGIFTNSIAILTDALHDAGDTASLGLAWYFEKLSGRGPNHKHTYGYVRFRLLGGLITGIVLIAGLSFIFWNAIGRLMAPEPVNAPGMMALAVLGILVNGAAVLRVKKGSSLTEKVVSWHLIEDTLGWAAVLIGAGIMFVWDLPIIDPILSIGISLFVLWNVGRNLKKVTLVFLQTTPDTFDFASLEEAIRSLPGVTSTHHSHSWSLDGESHVFTTHLIMQRESSRDDIVQVKSIVSNLLSEHGFTHVTIEVELEGESCLLVDEFFQDLKNQATKTTNHEPN